METGIVGFMMTDPFDTLMMLNIGTLVESDPIS